MDAVCILNHVATAAKRTLPTVMVLLLICTSCFASTITLQWDPETAPDLAGYKVYYSTTPAIPFAGTGATQGPSPLNVVSTQATVTITGLDPGQAYDFAVTAYNSAGVESPYSNIVLVPELVPPTVSITSPVNNASASGTVSVSASASDNVGVTSVEFYVNGALQSTDTAAPYLFSWNASSLAAGSYILSAKAYDAAGNVGQSGNVAVTVVNDTTPPLVSLTAPGNGVTVHGILPITANATDNIGVTKVEFYANSMLLFAGNMAPYSFNWDTAAVANGPYTLSAKAYDAAGNVGTSSPVVVTVNRIYTLAYNADVNGTISGITPQTVNSGGSGTQVTAVANPGYHFVSWNDGRTTAARTDANVTSNLSVTASFAVNSYTITFSAGRYGSISGTKTQSVGYGGSTSSVKAAPNYGHHFVNWTGTNGFVTTSANPLVLNSVKVNQSITANFK